MITSPRLRHGLRPLRMSPVRLCRHLHLEGWDHLHAARQDADGSTRGVVLVLEPHPAWTAAALAGHLYAGPLGLLDAHPFDRCGTNATLLRRLRGRLPQLRPEPPVFGSPRVLVRHLQRGGTVGLLDVDAAQDSGSNPARLARLGRATLLTALLEQQGRDYTLRLRGVSP